MKRIFALFLVFQFIAAPAVAGLPPTTVKGQGDTNATTTFNIQVPKKQATRINGTTALIETGNANILPNPGFEHSTYSTGWSATGGTMALGTSTNIASGSKSMTWDSSAAAQTIATTVMVPENLKGQPGEFSCLIKTPTGTATHNFDVYGTAAGASIGRIVVTTDTGFRRHRVFFTWPTTSSIQPNIASTAADEPLIAIDDCYLGSPRESIVSWSTGATYRMIHFQLSDTGAACTVDADAQSALSSCSRTATGRVTATFKTGVFSGTPTCLCMSGGTSGAHCQRDDSIGGSATSYSFRTYDLATPTITAFPVISYCFGPR